MKKDFDENWRILCRKFDYASEDSRRIEDFKLNVNNLEKENLFSVLKNGYTDDEEIERKMKIIRRNEIRNGKELTQFYL